MISRYRKCAAVLLLAAVVCRPALGTDLSVKEIRAPRFVYSTENNNICVTVSNSDSADRTVTVVVRLKPKDAEPRKIKQSFTARGRRDDSVLIPVNMADFPERAGTIAVTVKAGDEEVFSGRIDVRDSLAGLEGIETVSGGLFDAEGTPCVICTVLEDPAKYRKWAPYKWVRTRADRSPKRVLLLGSPMVNTLDVPEGPYVEELRRLVEADEEFFAFVPRGKGVRPVFEDMLRVKGLVREHRPDIFIFCPGLEDVYSSVPARDFARALDVLIDQVRSLDVPPRIVLVTPVPLLSDLELSEEHEAAVRKVARQHHTAIVDLRKVLGGNEKTLRKSYGDDDSKVFHLYPLGDAQEEIAHAIMRYTY